MGWMQNGCKIDGHDTNKLNNDERNQEFKEKGISKLEIGRLSEGHTDIKIFYIGYVPSETNQSEK